MELSGPESRHVQFTEFTTKNESYCVSAAKPSYKGLRASDPAETASACIIYGKPNSVKDSLPNSPYPQTSSRQMKSPTLGAER